MKKPNETNKQREDEQGEDREEREQRRLLKAFTGTVRHYFGKWQTIFGGMRDPRNPEMIIYPLSGLMCTGVMMFLFRLGARREINYKLRGNDRSRAKFAAWFGVEEIPHGDTLNYAFKGVDIEEVQGVVCRLVKQLIRKLPPSSPIGCPKWLHWVDGYALLFLAKLHANPCSFVSRFHLFATTGSSDTRSSTVASHVAANAMDNHCG
jgi:hypothetical protein